MIIIAKDGVALVAPAECGQDQEYVADGLAYFNLIAPSLIIPLRVKPADFYLRYTHAGPGLLSDGTDWRLIPSLPPNFDAYWSQMRAGCALA